MFHGIGLTVFRTNGFSESRAALWTTVIFGLAHATNLFSEGPGAFVQVFAAAVSGCFFFLTRRRTGGLVVPAVLHGLWSFSLISGAVVAGASHPASGLALLAVLVMVTLILVGRKRSNPSRRTSLKSAPPSQSTGCANPRLTWDHHRPRSVHTERIGAGTVCAHSRRGGRPRMHPALPRVGITIGRAYLPDGSVGGDLVGPRLAKCTQVGA